MVTSIENKNFVFDVSENPVFREKHVRPNTAPNLKLGYLNYFYKTCNSTNSSIIRDPKIKQKFDKIAEIKYDRRSKAKDIAPGVKVGKDKSGPTFTINAISIFKAYSKLAEDPIDQDKIKHKMKNLKKFNDISRHHSDKNILCTSIISEPEIFGLTEFYEQKFKRKKLTRIKSEVKEKSFVDEVRNIFDLIDKNLYSRYQSFDESPMVSKENYEKRYTIPLMRQSSESCQPIPTLIEPPMKRRIVSFKISQSKNEVEIQENYDQNEIEVSNPQTGLGGSPITPTSYLSTSFDNSLTVSIQPRIFKKHSEKQKKKMNDKPKYINPILSGPFGVSLRGKKIQECTDFGVLYKSSSTSSSKNPYKLSSSILKRSKYYL